MAIFRYSGSHFSKLDQTNFGAQGILERTDLQAALREQIDIVCPDCLLIAEEFSEWADSRRRIDLLVLDRNANLVVVEIKRNETGEHMELQALRYAAMVSPLTFKRTVEILGEYLQRRGSNEDAQQKLLSFLSWDEPQEEDFGLDVRIVLVAADFSRELTTTVIWLNQRGIDVRCVRLIPYQHGADTLVDVQQIIPLPEAESYQVRIRQQSEERRESRRSERDYTRYLFNGAVYNKRKLVLAVVLAWVKANSPKSLSELTAAFPQEIRRGGLFVPLQEATEIYERQAIARHFLGEDEVVRFTGNEAYAISNQWGSGTIENFAARARGLGLQIAEAS